MMVMNEYALACQCGVAVASVRSLSDALADVTPVQHGDVRFIGAACLGELSESLCRRVAIRCSLEAPRDWFSEKQVVVPGSSLVVVFDESSSVWSFRVVLVVDLHLNRNPGLWVVNENVGSPVMRCV